MVTFRIVAGKQVSSAEGYVKADSFQLSATSTRMLKRQQFLLIGQNVYVTLGGKPVKSKVGVTRVGVIAAQARWGAGMANLLDLIRNSDTFAKKGGQTYTGTATDIADVQTIAPGYRRAKVFYELTLNPGGKVPSKVKMVLTSKGKAPVTMTTTYKNWGVKFTPKVPR
jgi:hypothetical protein